MERLCFIIFAFSFAISAGEQYVEIKDDKPCLILEDGVYPIRNVFQYLICKDHKSSYGNCSKNHIFDPVPSKCVDVKTKTEKNFCENRGNGDWVNPWNCHTFFKCLNFKTTKFNCQLPNLNYNPFNDQCNYPEKYPCIQVSFIWKEENGKTAIQNVKTNICTGKKDGVYPLADTFAYVVCKGGKGSKKLCGNGTFFVPSQTKCVLGSQQSLSGFCNGRANMEWSNPWNCFSSIVCKNGSTKVVPCLINQMIYNPYNDVCTKNYICKTIYDGVSRARINVDKNLDTALQMYDRTAETNLKLKDICTTLDDGIYPIRDVMQFLNCTKHVSKIVDCPKGTIYLSRNNCTDASKFNINNFCNGRYNGNYRNPWDCTTYFACSSGKSTKRSCPSTLNYGPVTDSCDFPTVAPCKELPSNDDFCKGKADGKYAIPDVFNYIQCKDGKSTKVKCQNDYIFSEKDDACVNISTQSFTRFCQGRDSNVDWRNPWDCSSYIMCKQTVSKKGKCLINGFVFDAYNDVCVNTSMVPCFQVSASRRKIIQNLAVKQKVANEIVEMPGRKDICFSLADGNYAIRDVMQYLQCKKNVSKITDCPKGTIYLSGNNCTDASKFNITNFCQGRVDGNWKNPWDCHTYITCHAFRSVLRICNHIVTLNYNPVLDSCDFPKTCKQLDSRSKVQIPKPKQQTLKGFVLLHDPCEQLPDGYYVLRDVAKYLYCHSKHSHIISCPPKQIFVPGNTKCIPLRLVDKESFCAKRSEGNYRNPWNCHSYFTCRAGTAFERPCSLLATLNYDPVKDICEYPTVHKCVNVTVKSTHPLWFRFRKVVNYNQRIIL